MHSALTRTKNQANPKQKSNTNHLSVMQNLPGLSKSIGHFLNRRYIFALGLMIPLTMEVRADTYTETLNNVANVSNTYISNFIDDVAAHHTGTFRYDLNSPKQTQKLPVCSDPLKVKPLRDSFLSGRFLLKVHCSSPTQWSVSLPGEIHHTIQVVVSARPLNRGEVITIHDLQWKAFAAKLVRPGYSLDKEPLIGFEMKRSLQIDLPIKPSHITPPLLVKKGEFVSITAQFNNLRVKSSGIALSNGILGQAILVRNRKTKRVIEATIFAPGQVKVRL